MQRFYSIVFLIFTTAFLLTSICANAQKQTHISPGTAIVINSFPSYQHISKASDGGSMGRGTQGIALGGCNATCCSLWVYRVDIRVPGSIRVDFTNNVPSLTSAILAYKAHKKNASTFSDITYINRAGNFCGFRDSCQLGLFVGWNDKKSVLDTHAYRLTDTVGPGSYYFCVFPENQQTRQGKDTSSVRFRFQPFCPSGGVCNSQTVDVCDQSSYKLPGGKTVYQSGTYTDTFSKAGVGGKDSFVYTTLTLGATATSQSKIGNVNLCVGDNITKNPSTNLVSEAVFSAADDDWIETNEVADSIAGTNRSVFTWMRKSSQVSGSNQMIHAINTSSNGNVCLLQVGTSEKLELYEGSKSLTTGVVVTDGEWHHVGYTYNETTDSTLVYVDGKVELRFKNSQTVKATDKISIGQEFDSGSKQGNYYDGELAEMSIWNEVLSTSDVRSLMQSAITNQHARYKDLVAYYPMITSCATSNDTLYDYSGNNLHGVASSSLIQQTDSLVELAGYESSSLFNKEWLAGSTVLSSKDTLNTTLTSDGVHALRLYRDYFVVYDTFNVNCVACNASLTAPLEAKWIDGSNTSTVATGIYGTKGVGTTFTRPIAKIGFIDWVDSKGNYYLFGGGGYNDLWKWDGKTWTWLSGDSTRSANGFYGVKGLGTAKTTPSDRAGACGAVDQNDNFWLFGGLHRNDLWKWDGSVWTWMSGDSTTGSHQAVYGITGIPSSANVPGRTQFASCKVDGDNNLLVYGGITYNSMGGHMRAELWKWDGTNWTFVRGDKRNFAKANYGKIGVASSLNHPSARHSSASWVDKNGNFWIYGGTGINNKSSSSRKLNDLWKWDGNNWTWMHGDSLEGLKSNFGTLGTSKASNTPGYRINAADFTDCDGNLYLFGGVEGTDFRNDLWQWKNNAWTWIAGDSAASKTGVYGTKGIASSSNWPGARLYAGAYFDAKTGTMNLYGGSGYSSTSTSSPVSLGDFWQINALSAPTPKPEIKLTFNTTEILDGDATPSAGDSTNFGSVDTNSTAVLVTYTITNMGRDGDTLNLTGSPIVALSGSGASHFSVVSQPSKTKLDSGETTTFQVRYLPTAVGTHNAELSIANDDADENPYNFGIQGAGNAVAAPKPEISIVCTGIEITSGDNTPSSTDGTDFGLVDTNTTASKTFYIKNTGKGTLTLNTSRVLLTGNKGAEFTVSSQPSISIAAGDSSAFTIDFQPTKLGSQSITITINSNDADEATYTFDVSGTGRAVNTKKPEIEIAYKGRVILNGSVVWSPYTATDFGTVDANKTVSTTYYVKNLGDTVLTLNTIPVTNTGAKATEFTITTQPSTSIAAGDSSAFVVSFKPTAAGAISTTISVGSNDADENPSTFIVRGVGKAVAVAACTTSFPAPYKSAFVLGSSSLSNGGIYGSVGVASPYYYPHSAGDYATWVDSSNNFYLFGGLNQSNNKHYNSLWKWDGTNWTLINGNSTANRSGVYGTKGTGATSNIPGARFGAATFVDANGDFWLFGGQGYGATGVGRLNDLWKWDGTVWTWVAGDNSANSKAVYGTTGVAASTNQISGTLGASTWQDANGNFWVFGGYGYNASSVVYKNELWKWDGTNWTFIRGDKVTTKSTYGTQGVANAANTPGSRYYATSWTDSNDIFWLFGGIGPDYKNTSGYLNDLWKFDGTNWTWVHGDSTANLKPNYGEQLVSKSSNDIGGRARVTQFQNCQGDVFIAGGGYNNNNWKASTAFDLWKWDGSNWTWLQGDSTNIFGVSYGSGPTFSYRTWPSAREGAASFYNDSSGILTVFGGDFNGYGTRRVKNDLWQIDSIFLYAEIAVRYNDSININNASVTIKDSIGTDFGIVDTNYANIKRRFGIWNTGNFDLNLEDSVPVRITGSGASHFSIKGQPYHIINEGRGSLVDIIFRPSAVGVHTATITIPSNDKDENPFTFTIQGEGRKSSPLTAQVALVSNANCYNRADGVATATVSGGVKPFTYLWSNGDTSLTSSALLGGTQTFTVTDAAQTKYTASIAIGRPSALPVAIAEGDTIYMDGKDSVMATIASKDTSLRYMWSNLCDGGSDVWEPVGNGLFSPRTIDDPSFSMSRQGLYAAFRDRDSSGSVTVMKYNNGSWEVVGQRGFTPDNYRKISMSVSQNGEPHVAFTDDDYSDKISVMKYNGTTWQYVGSPGISLKSFSSDLSLAFDGNTPYLAYEEEFLSNKATVMKFDGTKWDTVGMAGFSGDDAENIKIAFDGSTPYVAFIDDDRSDAVTVMKYNGTAWMNVGSPAFSDTRVSYLGFTISNGVPYVAYRDGGGATVQKFDGVKWNIVGKEEFTPRSAYDISIAVVDSVPYVAFEDGDQNGATSVMKFQDTSWVYVGTPGFGTRSSDWSTIAAIGDTLYVAYEDGPDDNASMFSFKAGIFTYSDTLYAKDPCVFTLTVSDPKDTNGCTNIDTIYVLPNSPFNLSLAADSHVTCNGFANGGASASVKGGLAPLTYLWSNGDTTLVADSLKAGQYIFTVVDAKNDTLTDTLLISEPTALVATAKVDSNITCNGLSDGGATITATGGTTPYTYLWNNSATTASISGVKAGTYTVTVTDSNGCTATKTATITEPAILAGTAKVDSNITCNSLSDGGATITATGGTMPYKYLWSNSATTASITGVKAGTYTVTVTDANGCTISKSATITEPAILAATAKVDSNVTCNGLSDGGATITATGGTTPYKYLWSNSATTASITGVKAGTYTVTVTDANGCTISKSATITEPAILAATAKVDSNVSCNGLTNGGASISASGGTTPYKYLWSNSATTASITGVKAGTYTVTVTDANGCTINKTTTITEPTILAATTKVDSNISCNGLSDGGATITATGGTTPYTYLWSNAATTASITDVKAGTYTVTVTDANGCTINKSAIITEPTKLVVSAKVDSNVTCFGYNNGKATVTANGGTGRLQYVWNTYATTTSINKLIAGNYKVVVTDANACAESSQVSITQPALLVAGLIDGDTTICSGATPNKLRVSQSASGGAGSYTYVWQQSTDSLKWTNVSGATSATYQPGSIRGSNWFRRIDSDGNSCGPDTTNVLKVGVFAQPNAGFRATIACEGKQTNFTDTTTLAFGSINSYSWSFGDKGTSSQQNPINVYKSSGTYTVTLKVIADGGCNSTVTKTVNVNDVPSVDFSTTAECEGEATVFTNKSTIGSGTLSYAWDLGDNNSSTASAPNHTYVNSGYYTVQLTATSNNGCIDSVSKTVQVKQVAKPNFSATAVCEGNFTQFTNLSTNASTYSWDFGDKGNGSKQTDPKNKYKNSGAYDVVLTAISSDGCADTAKRTVSVYALPTSSFTATEECLREPTDFTNSSTGASSYQWVFGNGTSSNNTDPSVLYGTSGNYKVELTATTANGCTDVSSSTITVNALPNVVFTAADICLSEDLTTVNNTTGANSYAWIFGDGNTAATKTPTHTYTTHGQYEVMLAATSSKGCVNSDSADVSVYAVPEVTFTSTDVCFGLSTDFSNTSKIAAGTMTYIWDLGDGSTTGNPSPSYAYGSDGTYVIKLVATSNQGCKDSTTGSVDVYAMPTVDFTTASVCYGDTLFTTNLSSTANYDWSFDDGNISTDASPFNFYKAAGDYSVQLIATTPNNCIDSLSKTISIYSKPIADFDVKDVCDQEAVQFANTSYNAIITGNSWDFGDGNTDNRVNPSNLYSGAGGFTTTLIVMSNEGCSDTISKALTVHPNPTMSFTNTTECDYDTTVFTDGSSISTGTIGYAWDFGTGDASSVASPTYQFASAGAYKVTLTGTSDQGCIKEASAVVVVNPSPKAVIDLANNCEGMMSQFASLSTVDAGSLSTYAWDFGDAITSADQNPMHLYGIDGTYTVELVVETDQSCYDTTISTITIYNKPTADFNSPDICFGSLSVFTDASVDASEYLYDFGDKWGISTLGGPEYTYEAPGTYDASLFVTSIFGCRDTVTKSIEIYSLPTAQFSVNHHCFGEDFTPKDNSIGDVADWSWSYDDGNDASGIDPIYTYGKDGSYSVKLEVEDDNGCIDSLRRTLVVWPLPVVGIRTDTLVSKGYNVPMLASGGVEYKWSPVDNLDRPLQADPTATVVEDVKYTVTVANEFGCTRDTFVNLRVEEDYTLEPSNIMTPDGNGQNDNWIVEKAQYYNDVEVIVFDRWGRIVYQNSSYDNTWAGVSEATGNQLPDGAYYYVVKVPADREEYKGSITIFR